MADAAAEAWAEGSWYGDLFRAGAPVADVERWLASAAGTPVAARAVEHLPLDHPALPAVVRHILLAETCYSAPPTDQPGAALQRLLARPALAPLAVPAIDALLRHPWQPAAWMDFRERLEDAERCAAWGYHLVVERAAHVALAEVQAAHARGPEAAARWLGAPATEAMMKRLIRVGRLTLAPLLPWVVATEDPHHPLGVLRELVPGYLAAADAGPAHYAALLATARTAPIRWAIYTQYLFAAAGEALPPILLWPDGTDDALAAIAEAYRAHWPVESELRVIHLLRHWAPTAPTARWLAAAVAVSEVIGWTATNGRWLTSPIPGMWTQWWRHARASVTATDLAPVLAARDAGLRTWALACVAEVAPAAETRARRPERT